MVEADVNELENFLKLATELGAKAPIVSGQTMYKLVKKKQGELEDLWLELTHDLDYIKNLIASIRRKVSDSLSSSDNFRGFLQGDVDDYLETYEAQSAKIEAQFYKSRVAL
mmetsp:Transcript_14915/g.20217  ORF Transcript_14915/g.20217 Transcript_14915/m.20217 type:complete len:111 (+) Transcript_14915:25-357(+)